MEATLKKKKKQPDNAPTSTGALPQELLDDLRFGVVAVVFGHRGAEFAELSEEAVFVLGVRELAGQAAALDSGRRGRGHRAGGGGARLRS